MPEVPLPASMDEFRRRGPAWAAWLDALPGLVADLVEDWALRVDGAATRGHTALVLPVRTAGRRPAALKVVGPDPEAEHEHLVLKAWAGQGAVELLRADPHRSALLLERLHPEDLTGLWDVEACEVVAGLYPRLHRPAPPQLRTLTAYVERWTAQLETGTAPVPPRLVQQALSVGRAFAADPESVGTLVHGDLHYENVLAADREPWLVIDPKPVSGDPHYEVAPLLWNRFEELHGDVRDGVRRRFHAVVDAAGLDEHRARDWVVLRMVCNAVWGMDPTLCVAVAKAVQD